MNKQLTIEVHADWAGLANSTLMGKLYATVNRGQEIFSFEYSKQWLKNENSYPVDPSLQLFQGIYYAPTGQENFGAFLDSAPDRWGRFLMERRESLLAREQKRKARKLLSSDYLLGVYDEHRMGALRFKIDPEGPFLDNNKLFSAPPWAALRELATISQAIEQDYAEEDPNYSKWLQMLIIPGSSLGGARPKASVIDEQKRLWIAKFPSSHDPIDIGAWEMVVNKLADKAGIILPQVKLQKFNARHHTFLSKRFDRTKNGERLHFTSAMTLLQRCDGDDASNGASYLELAEFIIRFGAQPLQDLEQLWRRIVFYICVSNVDDHLRNHGFILQANGWILSPAYDINPVATGDGLKLNISEVDNSQDLELALEVAKYFQLNQVQARKIMHEVIKVVKLWRKEANLIKISTSEQDRMSAAFRVVDVE